METVNILAARNTLSRLVAVASAGEDVVIAKRGVPVARLVAIESTTHSASAAAAWLTMNHVPKRAARPPAELDEQIASERAGWE